jgi:hypothetical protein
MIGRMNVSPRHVPTNCSYGRHSPILIGIHFVLRRQRLHWHAFGRIPLQELQVSASPEGDLLILQHPYTGVVHEHLPRRNIDTPA